MKGGVPMGRHKRGRSRSATRAPRRPSLVGTVRLTDAGGMVETAEGQFRLVSRSMREVMGGDTVAVSLHRGPHGERRAQVESVVERAQHTVVGSYHAAGPLGAIRPLDTRLKADFFVLPTDDSPARAHVAEGDIVAARILTYPTRMESGIVTIERRMGSVDAPDVGIRCVMARYDLEDGYPEAALAEAAGLALDVEAALADPLRHDIRDRFIITIDPVDACDFDDAISITRTPAGGWRLGVSIADVSHYVAWESSIDLEARRRSTSVYLADRVLPMLPERLSCDVCSLKPGEDRLAMTVDMELDERGRVRASSMYPSAIRSRVRLAYEEADAILAGGELGDKTRAKVAAARASGVDLAAFLADADALAQARRAVRHARGAVDFDTVEVHAIVGADGMPQALTSRERTRATSLIEEAMLLANECVAARLDAAEAPAAFRVHEPPTPDHLHSAAWTLAELGIIDRKLAGRIAVGDQAAMRGAIERSEGTSASELVNALLLRSMQRALYKATNDGHYALGATAYCHFTSPIRRYPDLIVHRALKMLLAREQLGARAAKERSRRLVGEGREAQDRILPMLCRHASERERIADAAEHATQKVEVALFYASRIGERSRATVTWIDKMGVFARLDDTHAEGLIRYPALGDEWFDLDEDALMVRGASTGRTVCVGDRIVVEVVATNPVRGHLDLKLIAGRRALH